MCVFFKEESGAGVGGVDVEPDFWGEFHHVGDLAEAVGCAGGGCAEGGGEEERFETFTFAFFESGEDDFARESEIV